MAEGGVTQSHEVLKNELQKCMQIIETTLNKISGLDVVINPADVQLEFERLTLEWRNFEQLYKDYAAIVTESTDLWSGITAKNTTGPR